MNCDTSRELMMKYFDGEMDEAGEKQFREHLKTCGDCSDEFSCMEAIFASLDEKVGIEPPDDFEARVMDKVALIENQKGKEAGRGSYGCITLRLYFRSYCCSSSWLI